MVVERACRGIGNKGGSWRALRLRDADYYILHDPEHAEALRGVGDWVASVGVRLQLNPKSMKEVPSYG